MGGTGWDEASRTVECQRPRGWGVGRGAWGVGRGAWGVGRGVTLRGGVSKYFNNEHVCRKKHLRILLRQYVTLISIKC